MAGLFTMFNKNPIPVLRRKLGSWRRKSLAEQGWFMVAYPLLGLARLALLTVPFRHLAPWLGDNLKTSAAVPLVSERQARQALEIGRAVRTAARYTPWESKCLAQAMVARLLLGLRGIPYALFLGVRKDETDPAGMAAHAWVCSGPAFITGGRSFGQFTVVGTFISSGVVGA
jgi:hypothetical protein